MMLILTTFIICYLFFFPPIGYMKVVGLLKHPLLFMNVPFKKEIFFLSLSPR